MSHRVVRDYAPAWLYPAASSRDRHRARRFLICEPAH